MSKTEMPPALGLMLVAICIRSAGFPWPVSTTIGPTGPLVIELSPDEEWMVSAIIRGSPALSDGSRSIPLHFEQELSFNTTKQIVFVPERRLVPGRRYVLLLRSALHVTARKAAERVYWKKIIADDYLHPERVDLEAVSEELSQDRPTDAGNSERRDDWLLRFQQRVPAIFVRSTRRLEWLDVPRQLGNEHHKGVCPPNVWADVRLWSGDETAQVLVEHFAPDGRELENLFAVAWRGRLRVDFRSCQITVSSPEPVRKVRIRSADGTESRVLTIDLGPAIVPPDPPL